MRRKNPISHSYTIIALIAVILVAGSFMAYVLYGGSEDASTSSQSDVVEPKSTDTQNLLKSPQVITLHNAQVDIQPATSANSLTAATNN